MAWCLYLLCKYPDCQQKLREELLSVPGDMPDITDLNMLPYLDGVLREALRLYPAIPYTMRLANKDDTIPLSTPYKDTNGVLHGELRSVSYHASCETFTESMTPPLQRQERRQFHHSARGDQQIPGHLGPRCSGIQVSNFCSHTVHR